MKPFSINIFLSQVGRLSASEVQKLVEEHLNDLQKISIVDANQIFNFVETKFKIVSDWQNSDGMVDVMTFKMIATKIPELSVYTFEEINNINRLNPTIQVELAHILNENEKLNLLNNFGDKLTPLVIQNFVLALSLENQKKMIVKFKDKITDCDSKLLLSFLGTLQPDNQKFFLSAISDYVKSLDAESISTIITSIYEENIEYFFTEYHNCIESFDEKSFVKFLSMLSGNGIVLCSKFFESKIKDIPAEVLMYKLGMSVDDPDQIYSIWKSNSSKLTELSDTYFNLIISRLDDNSRLNSLSDFKDKYNNMDAKWLLDLFKFDSDEIKTKLFLEYKNKISEIDGKTFIDYVNENISSSTLKNKVFLSHKDYLCDLLDEDFIYFIGNYSENNLKYSWSRDEKEATKEELIDYIFANFSERLKAITSEFIPKLFSDSDSCLQHKYVEVLSESIKKLIHEKTYIEKLLHSVWGDSKNEILTTFLEQFKELSAKDWYSLLSVIGGNEYKIIENLLLECDLNNFDFIDKENLLNNGNAKRMFYYFERNLQNKMYAKYTELAENNNREELMAEYEKLMTKVVDEDTENVLIDYNCINLLVLLRVLLKHHIINDKDDYYQMFKEMYMSKLLNGLDKENAENIDLIRDSLFYRLVKGSVDPTMLTSIKTLKGLIFFNKNIIDINDRNNINIYAPAEIEPFVENLTETQVIALNNKLFKQVCEKLLDNYKDEYPEKSSIRNLAVRLYLSVGYQNAKRLIDLKVPFTRYEYIFNGIDIKRINLNDNGEPIINKKLNDFMFGSNISDDTTNINRLLQDKIPEFEKRFADIYNGWETIYQNLNGNVSVARILKWFEENKVLLNPDEYRLSSVLSEIGTDERNLSKARELYSDMKNRKFSTIPKVSGSYNDDYTYEMLDLDDPLGLVVGYITRCCFLIDGASKSSLFHSAQSKDGRIFIVRKNGELIAQSWVWRNGNLVCFDNVEARGNYDWDILLETYKKASQNILDISAKDESTKEQIKLVTFGGGYSKISKPKNKVPEDKIQTPRVDDRIYCDAKYEQFILASNGERELYYGDVKAQYKDTRKKPDRYVELSLLDREQKSSIIKKIRSIEFVKTGNIRMIDFDNYKYGSIADDWYILLNNNGEVECMLLENDSRAREELYDEIDKLEKTFTEMGVYADSKSVSGKVLSLVKGSEH